MPDRTPGGHVAQKAKHRLMREAELVVLQLEAEILRREIQIEANEERLIVDREALIEIAERIVVSKIKFAELKEEYQKELEDG